MRGNTLEDAVPLVDDVLLQQLLRTAWTGGSLLTCDGPDRGSGRRCTVGVAGGHGSTVGWGKMRVACG